MGADATTIPPGSLPSTGPEEPIAIVGLSGRYVSADCMDDFWANVISGRCIVDGTDMRRAFITPVRGPEPDTDVFSAAVAPAAAHALNAAREAIATWHGSGQPAQCRMDIWVAADSRRRSLTEMDTGGSLASWLAQALGTHGQAADVAYLCSSFSVAIDRAARALRSGRCQTALVCAVSVGVERSMLETLKEVGSASPWSRTEAAGAVVLRRISDTVATGETVFAILRAIECERESVKGLIGNLDQRSALIDRALTMTGIECDCHVEMQHFGRDTLSEQYEFEAFRQAFGGRSGRPTIGGVAAVIGYVEAAVGLAEIQKGALALTHQLIPPAVRRPASHRAWAERDDKFRLLTNAEVWMKGNTGRYWCVSTAGGGYHSFIVLSDQPRCVPAQAEAR